LDDVFVERLWRSVKYEEIYLRDYEDGLELEEALFEWFAHYNDERPHQALGYATPRETYRFPESYGARANA
jgi:putative transposase